ncbi:MAG TPA: hypothetical protein PLR99_33475 [Polyangiaceae bacterium]|nr:hypothetical protein [Polyangiaceae bacterium]
MRLLPALAANLLVATSVACSLSTATIPDGFTAACEGSALRLAPGLRPGAEVDFVGFRVESTALGAASAGAPAEGPCPAGAPCAPRDPATPSVPSGPSGTAQVAQWSARFTDDVRGVPCARAADRALCEKRVAELRLMASQCDGFAVVPKFAAPDTATPSRPQGSCTQTYLVYTRGDEVGTVSTAEAARAFLGAIDTPEEALFLAGFEGESFACGGPAPAAYSAVADGFELVASATAPDRSCQRRFVSVSKAGVVRFLRLEPC